MAEQFQKVRNNRPGRTKFPLTPERKFTADFGTLYPILVEPMIPGDIFKIGASAVVRAQPLMAPILHRVDVKTEYFFVPFRILYKDWEEFITGGEDGYKPLAVGNEAEVVLPQWTPEDGFNMVAGTLWDFLGFPTIADGNVYNIPSPNDALSVQKGMWPSDFPRRAYNYIWWEYYRDQNLQANPRNVPDNFNDRLRRENFIGFIGNLSETTESINGLCGRNGNQELLNRNWEKDYFTSALPFQQKGDTPALPIAGNLVGTVFGDTNDDMIMQQGEPVEASTMALLTGDKYGVITKVDQSAWPSIFTGSTPIRANIDLSEAVTFDVSDLRLAFQTQRWLEQNARAGTRYTEFLRSHFGVSPTDSRLDRPEYIGGNSFPLIISEVLQTSQTTDGSTVTSDASPQGNMSGHGIGFSNTYVGSYRAEEYGIIIGLFSVMPKPAYQQGMPRKWLYKTPLDFYFPEFAHLSERGVEQQEIYWTCSGTTPHIDNSKLFGFQGMYDELRYSPNTVHGLFRSGPTTDGNDGFSFWHLGRMFDSAPVLNDTFIKVDSTKDKLKRSFFAPSEPAFFVSYGNSIEAIRPLPWQSEPGLIDHVGGM